MLAAPKRFAVPLRLCAALTACVLYTGYDVKTLPGIREAIEERRWEEADRYIGVVSRTISAYSERLDRAIAVP